MSSKLPTSEFADDKHRAQAEALLLEIGRFAVAFERMCEAMRNVIMLIFYTEGLANPGLAQVVVGDKASAELQVLLGALFAELRARYDDEDRRVVQSLLKEVKELTEERNIVIHSAWQFGRNSAFAELYATTVRPRTKQNKGAVPELHGLSAKYIRELTGRCKAAQVKLQRLEPCLLPNGPKVSAELTSAREA